MKITKSLKYSLILLSVFLTHQTLSQTITNEALYNRCYSKLTNDLPPKDAVYDSIVLKDTNPAQGKDAIDACIDVFNKANFGTTNTLPQVNGVYDPTGMKVLKTMYDVHRSFFLADNLINAFLNDVVDNPGSATSQILDSNAAALYYTRALFRSDIPAKYIVMSKESPRAIRISNVDNSTTNYKIFLSHASNQYSRRVFSSEHLVGFTKAGNSYSDIREVNPNLKMLSYGRLVGIELDNTGNTSRYYNGLPHDSAGWTDRAKFYEIFNPPLHDLTKSYGGGFLGNQSFMMLHWGIASRINIDGGLLVPRRMTSTLFKILFDRSLPVLKQSHVTDLVDTSSTLPFRKSSSCMQCHATMDPMAYTYRDFYYSKSRGANGNIAMMVKRQDGVNYDKSKITESLDAELSPWPTNDPYFHLRPTNGRLYFTDYNGDLVDVSVSSLDQLGAEIAKTEDFYITIAKRYFQFFTGIDVNIANLELEPLVDDEFKAKKLEYRNFVIKLGKELKEDPNQSLKQLVYKILRSSAFKYPGKGVE